MRTIDPNQQVDTRTELLSLLSDACELEHGLACCYLYAAFSLKQDISEGGIDWKQLQQIRLWASQLYFVASQEMLHLAQAWNLLAAIGGTPYFMRPTFPQRSDYYPLGLPLRLDPFGLETIRRFAAFERPADQRPDQIRGLDEFSDVSDVVRFDFNSVGALYRLIASGFTNIAEQDLFLPSAGSQITATQIDFPALVAVTDRDSALAAITMITSQGEGTPTDQIDCHFGVYKSIIRDLQDAQAQLPGFAPARNTISNPNLKADRATSDDPDQTLIADTYAAAVAEQCDAVYVLMLRLLQYVFDRATTHEELIRRFSRLALELMVRVVKPLGEALTLLPAGDPIGRTAAAPFTLERHVPLPLDATAASMIVNERLHELRAGLDVSSGSPQAPAQLKSAARTFTELTARFGTSTTP